MKKLMTLSMAFLFSATLVFGQVEKKELRMEVRQKLTGLVVNNKTKENFYKDFGNDTDVKWEREDYYDVATFTKDGNTTKAFYNFDSQLIGTTRFVAFTDIPQEAQKKINKKYGKYKIGRIIFYDDNEPVDVDFFMYGSQFKHEDNYFIEMTKGNKKIVLKVNKHGDVSHFMRLK